MSLNRKYKRANTSHRVALQREYTFLLKASNVVEHPHSSIFRDDFHSRATVLNSFSNCVVPSLALVFSSWFAVFSIMAFGRVSMNLLSNLCIPFFCVLLIFRSCPKELTRYRRQKSKYKSNADVDGNSSMFCWAIYGSDKLSFVCRSFESIKIYISVVLFHQDCDAYLQQEFDVILQGTRVIVNRQEHIFARLSRVYTVLKSKIQASPKTKR